MSTEQRLRKICGRFRGKMRVLLIQYGVLRTVFFCLFLALVLMLGDWYFRFSPDGRLLSLLAVIAVGGLCYYFDFHRTLGRSWNDDEVLGYLDRTSEGQDDTLTTLRDLQNPKNMREYDTDEGKEIVHGVVEDLEKRASDINLNKVMYGKPINRWRLVAGAVLGFYALGMIFPKSDDDGSYLLIGLKRLVMPYALIYWPQKTRIEVREPESGWRVPKGEALEIVAMVDGEVPPVVDIVYKNDSSQLWITERMSVNPVDPEAETAKNAKGQPYVGKATFTFGDLVEPLTFYCIGGDDLEKRKFPVTVAERPMLTSIKATYSFPPYTRLPKKLVSSGQIAGLEGTEVKLDFVASSDLTKATIAFALDGAEEGIPQEIKDVSGDTFSHTFRLTKSGRYNIELTDEENLKNGKPERYEIKVEPDKIPEVTLEEPVRDLILTSRGKVRVKFKAEDDYNLTELNVMLAPEGGKGEPLTDRITGPFWNNRTNLHPVGEGEFVLDFLKEKDKESLKKWKIEEGAELELWVYAKDCNPYNPGITESPKIRLSLLQQTDFMESVVLKAKELMLDARTGWFAAAGAYHDGGKWARAPKDENELENIMEQAQTAERASLALSQRFPEILEHMQRNRLYAEFMGKRLERIGGAINSLQSHMPKIGEKLSAGRPSSSEEDTPQRRMSKMAKALLGARDDMNKAAWQYRYLYNRLADWIDLQSVLLKTRRIEEHQGDVNGATVVLVKKTLGMEKEELDDDLVREMKEVSNQQQTVFEMQEAVEKELAKLIKQADKDGRKKIWEFLAKSFYDLRENRIKDKLKRAALAIGDARGDTVKKDQELVIKTIAVLNRGLIKAGEEVPEDPPIKGPIEDPRGKETAVAKVDQEGEEIDADAYKKIEALRTLDQAAKDTLGGTLQEVYRQQEDTRNRTSHIFDRMEGKGVNKRYVRLRVGLTGHRQGDVVKLLKKAVAQVPEYGQQEKPKEGEKPLPLDPTNDRARTRMGGHVQDMLAASSDAQNLIKEAQFGHVALGIQENIFRSSRDLRVYMQGREAAHGLWIGRKEKNFKDEFDRKFLLREKNLEVMIEAGKNLEWVLALQAAAQRESQILAKFVEAKAKTPAMQAAADRIKKAALARNQQILGLVEGVHKAVKEQVTDPEDKEKANEKVKPQLTEQVLQPLAVDQFKSALADFKNGGYAGVAQSQESMRRSISAVLVSLKDLYEARVPERPVDIVEEGSTEVVEEIDGRIEYRDEAPEVLAELLEKEGGWIDEVVKDPQVRARLIKELRERKKFHTRYSRLQSAYFQAVAQNFQARANKKKKDDDSK